MEVAWVVLLKYSLHVLGLHTRLARPNSRPSCNPGIHIGSPGVPGFPRYKSDGHMSCCIAPSSACALLFGGFEAYMRLRVSSKTACFAGCMQMAKR